MIATITPTKWPTSIASLLLTGELFFSLKATAPPERLKAIEGLRIRFESVRGKRPNIMLEWTDGTFAGKEQVEEGLKQMLDGFDQMYWSLIASPPLDSGADITKIEPLTNGEAKVYSSGQNSKVVITIDKENIPRHYTLDTPGMNGTIDLRYVSAPKPVAGDLRRISAMDVSERIGTTIINIKLELDYQAAGEFYVPKHVSYELGGRLHFVNGVFQLLRL